MKSILKKLSVIICIIMLIQTLNLLDLYHVFAEDMTYSGESGQTEQISDPSDTEPPTPEQTEIPVGETLQTTTSSAIVVPDQELIQTVTSAAIKLQMYNVDRSTNSNTIYANFKLINTGTEPVSLSDLKIRYYYMLGGEISQNFWCDWSSAGTSNVKGTIVRNDPLYQGADTYVEIEFIDGSGNLAAGSDVEIKTRFARTDWNNYRQSDDYSFNSTSTDYEDWSKAIVYAGGTKVWGEEPSVLMPQITSAGVKMFNHKRNDSTSTIYPWFMLYNTGTLPFDLEDVKIRYYYTIDGEKEQNFWCDWSSAGSSNVTGTFVKIPFAASGVDYYYELGFKAGSGSLIAGDFEEIQTRIAKTDWSDYTQSNDYSFNADANKYTEWTKIGVYINGKLVWGEGLLFGVPQNILHSAAENEIHLSWDNVEGATGYDVEVDGTISNNGMNTSHDQENLLSGTMHTYRIRAVSPIMDGDWSDPIEIWTLPGIPQNISAAGTGNSISLSWDPVTGAEGYDVEVQGAPVDNGSNTTFIQTGLNPNLQQTYRVRAKNSSGAGKWSGIIAKSTLPSIPSNLNYTSTEDEIRISWNAAAGAAGYDVEIDGESVVQVAETFCLHSGLSPFTEHFYRVRSTNADGTSNWSEKIYASTLLPVPSNLEARVTGKEITVTWDAVENANGYDIEVDGVLINNGNLTTYTHEGILPNTEHTYRVRARNGTAVSRWSEEITRKTLTGVPANISATATSTEVTVTWEPVVGALGYELEADGIIIDIGMNTVYNHSGLRPNSVHNYRVRAVNAAGPSQWSEFVTISTTLNTPANLRKASGSATSITITWDVVEGADGYDVMADGMVIDNGTSTSYTHSGLEPGSTHIYRVRARNGEVSGDWSQELGAWSDTLVVISDLGIPGNIQTIATSTNISLFWDEVTGATGYDVEMDGQVVSVGNDTVFIHSALVPNTMHSYRVRAKNDTTLGEWSEIITQKTAFGAPANLRADAATTEITVMWDSVNEVLGYDLEIDGEIIADIQDIKYIHKGLQPNTRHSYRVRAISEDGPGEWSNRLEQNTNPELKVNVLKDNMFNFVIAVPQKKDLETRTITVNYNPDEIEVVDLCGSTQKTDMDTGIIEGTNITVQEASPGSITYSVPSAGKTVVIIVKFISKTNEPSRVTYSIE